MLKKDGYKCKATAGYWGIVVGKRDNGKAFYIAKNGFLFEGIFKDYSPFEGYDCSNNYCGPLKNSLYHGQGTYISDFGDKYVGEFKEGKKDGYGRMVFYN